MTIPGYHVGMGWKRGTGTVLLLLPLLLTGCGSDSGDDDIEWKATFVAAEGDGTSTGGLVIQAEGKTLAHAAAWLLAEPAPFADPIPPAELSSIGEALFFVDAGWAVLDAVAAPGGVVALLADPAGGVTLRHFADSDGVPVPDHARRVLLAGENPVRVLVVLEGDEAVLATSTR